MKWVILVKQIPISYYISCSSPFGTLYVGEDKEKICRISFFDDKCFVDAQASYKETSLLLSAKKQFDEYFVGKRQEFNLPLLLKGTDFQNLVWKELMNIPYGNVTTYSDIATAIGRPKAFRAVGMANHDNPLPIIIPCHRVLGKNGKLTGYAYGLDVKEKLLTLEKAAL